MNPTTDWADLNRSSVPPGEADLAKLELKAMIERKRRNDFVRKREFEMLRKIRREGVTGEGLAGLDGLSRLEDSEVRITEDFGMRAEYDVKDKIDEIERLMVGDASEPIGRRASTLMPALTAPSAGPGLTTLPPDDAAHDALLNAFKPTTPQLREPYDGLSLEGEPDSIGLSLAPRATSPARLPETASRPPVKAVSAARAVEVTEVTHDPELDEAVMAFASADNGYCEQILTDLIRPNGDRSRHVETWFVLFDLYRATGEQAKFDALAMDYMQRFGCSPPQWYSLPRMVADAAMADAERPSTRHAHLDAQVGWVAPEHVDLEAVHQLRSQLLHLPLPWVLDWRAVLGIDVQASAELVRLMHDWGDQPLDMRWLGGSRLLDILCDIAPTGSRSADPSFWMLRMEALRLTQRPHEFDQAALDYCMTYEVSPPSWSPAKCAVKMTDLTGHTEPGDLAPEASIPSASFVESLPYVDSDPQQASIDLNGQLVGDIGPLLARLGQQVGNAPQIQISCTRLIRMDFIAAGDLLNWVIARRGEKRSVAFVDTHRLVALFCGAMGITEHARVTLRRN